MEGAGERARRYVRLPEDCVSLCMENLGIQASRDVTSSLVEDVSFRIRQVTNLAVEFMSHAKRKRLSKEDFDSALKWSGLEPLYGLSAEPPSFMYVHENGLYSVEDQEVLLQELSLSSPVPPTSLPPPPSLSAQWLVVEGIAVDSELTEDSQNVPPTTVELKRDLIESHQSYRSLLMEAVTGDSEELRRIALADIQTNPATANILPDLVQYLLETLSCWVQFTPAQLMRVLKMLHALFRNRHLFLDPYGTGLFPLVKSIVLTHSYLHTGDVSDHWHVREMSALCLAEITGCCGTLLNEYIPDIYTSFRHVLAQSDVSLQVLYGVVLSLCHLGGKSLAEVLFPRLDTVTLYIQSLFDSRDLAKRDVALKVYEALLLSAEILLTSQVPVEVKPEHITSATSAASSLHQGLSSQQLGGARESGFLSGFGGSAEKSIMDTSELGLVGEPPPNLLPSLYEFLVDLFGEKLVLRLTPHIRNVSSSSCERKIAKKSPAVQGRESESQSRERKGMPREDPLLSFLKREGFRPYKVQLPLKPMPRKAPAFHPWGRQLWRFNIPTTLLPVQGNMLEGRTRRRPKGSVPLKATRGHMHRSRNKSPQIVDLGAVWL